MVRDRHSHQVRPQSSRSKEREDGHKKELSGRVFKLWQEITQIFETSPIIVLKMHHPDQGSISENLNKILGILQATFWLLKY